VTRYFDASALAKRYLDEAGSASVRRLSASGTVATSRLSEIEVTSAVERRIREGVLGRHPLRSGDAIQLATAVYLAGQLGRRPPFVVFDDWLAAAAAAEGLSVIGRSRRR
jgi:hypothetical protein